MTLGNFSIELVHFGMKNNDSSLHFIMDIVMISINDSCFATILMLQLVAFSFFLRHQRDYQVGYNYVAINKRHFLSNLFSSSDIPERFSDFSCMRFPFKRKRVRNRGDTILCSRRAPLSKGSLAKEKALSHVKSFWSEMHKKYQKLF